MNNKINNESRNNIIDIIKALGIIFMVVGHSGSPFRREIYLFHMPLFFIIAGYCLKDSYSDNLESVYIFIKKKIRSLYFPCLLMCTIYALLHNVFIKLNLLSGEEWNIIDYVKQLIKCILFAGGTEFSGTAWFLRTLFISLILYIITEYILKSIKIYYIEIMKTILFLFVLGIVFFIPHGIKGYNYLNCISTLMLLQIGHIIKKVKITNWMIIPSIIILLIMTIADINIELSENDIYNPIVFIICSIAGFIMCYVIANTIKNYFSSQFIEYIGRHTMEIMVMHFICFKFVTFLQIVMYHYPIEKLRAFPYLLTNGLWWLVYTVVGVMCPLSIIFLFTNFEQKCVRFHER